MTLITLVLRACQDRLIGDADIIKLYRALGALMVIGGVFLMDNTTSYFGSISLLGSILVFMVASRIERKGR